jgi:hypothetical protein
MSAGHSIRHAAGSVEANRALRILARGGYAGSAAIHLLIGFLAIRVVLHDPVESDQAGAIAQIALLPGGMVLLWALTVALFALALWLTLQALRGAGSVRGRRWARRLESLAKAAAYLVLGLTALAFARGSGADASASTRQTSSAILGLPEGQLLLGAIGVVTSGVGIYLLIKGLRRRFLADIVAPTDGRARTAVVCLGVVGYVAKGIAIAIVGVLFVVAAATLRPDEASGLDGALKSLVALPLGAVLLVAIGVGLISFGLYTFVRAALARL